MTRRFFQAARNAAARPALVDGPRERTYGDLLRESRQICDLLISNGDDLGEARIAFLVPAGFDYVATLWGIWAAGGVAVPLSPMHPLPELAYMVEDTGSDQLIVALEFEQIATALSGTSKLQVHVLPAVETSRTIAKEALPDVDGARRAMILYTSGSTGRPKGVVATHANIEAQVDALVDAWEWSREDRILHVLPLHHVHGIVNVLLCALRVGALCEFAHPFCPEVVWDRISRGELTLFMAVPTIYAKLISAFDAAEPETRKIWAAAAGAMRLHVSGSAALPVSILERWESMTGQRLLERYGMTEIGMALSNPYRGERRPGFVGRPLPGVDVRRVDESGAVVADDEAGEIEVRGPTVFPEYWNRPDETAASFRDGWFRTGDVGVVEDGSYRILGRSSVDIIKTGGHKVSAIEVEEVLRTHPSIQDCAVVGVPDEEWGERIAVLAVCDDTLDLASLREWGKQRLASYKVPSMLHAGRELPRNAMGKVQKHLVQQLFDRGDSDRRKSSKT